MQEIFFMVHHSPQSPFSYGKKILLLGLIGIFAGVFSSTSTADETVVTDLTKLDNLFSVAYKWEKSSKAGYNSQAFTNFTKKLNAAIRAKQKEQPLFKELLEQCECDDVVRDEFDDYIKSNQYKNEETGEISFGIAVSDYFHENLEKKAVWQNTIAALESLIQGMIDNIVEQVQEQMVAYETASGMWLYMDGDTENSPYDILDDIARIDEIFFNEAIGFGDFKNSTKNDSSALITGRVTQWTWASGENYNIDLASDVEEALGGWDNEDGSSDNELAGDCDSGFCTTIDFIKNTHYFLGWSGSTSPSFQWIYERWLDWLMQKWDKLNLACKAPPAIFQYESENTLMRKFKEFFKWDTISVDWRPSKLTAGFIDRNKSTSSADKEKKDAERKRQTVDTMKRTFKKYGMSDYSRSNNIKWTDQDSYEISGMRYSIDGPVNFWNAADWFKRGTTLYKASLKSNGSGDKSGSPFVKAQTVDVVKHMEKAFDELLSRIKFITQHIKDLSKILKYVEWKDYCQN